MKKKPSGGFLQDLTLRGRAGSLVWGYRSAATVSTWSVERRRPEDDGPWEWTLRGRVDGKVDAFALRQRPLLFSAPRRGGFFTWPVKTLHVIETPPSVIATLSPPEY